MRLGTSYLLGRGVVYISTDLGSLRSSYIDLGGDYVYYVEGGYLYCSGLFSVSEVHSDSTCLSRVVHCSSVLYYLNSGYDGIRDVILRYCSIELDGRVISYDSLCSAVDEGISLVDDEYNPYVRKYVAFKPKYFDLSSTDKRLVVNKLLGKVKRLRIEQAIKACIDILISEGSFIVNKSIKEYLYEYCDIELSDRTLYRYMVKFKDMIRIHNKEYYGSSNLNELTASKAKERVLKSISDGITSAKDISLDADVSLTTVRKIMKSLK